jgi:hypothetical protein
MAVVVMAVAATPVVVMTTVTVITTTNGMVTATRAPCVSLVVQPDTGSGMNAYMLRLEFNLYKS